MRWQCSYVFRAKQVADSFFSEATIQQLLSLVAQKYSICHRHNIIATITFTTIPNAIPIPIAIFRYAKFSRAELSRWSNDGEQFFIDEFLLQEADDASLDTIPIAAVRLVRNIAKSYKTITMKMVVAMAMAMGTGMDDPLLKDSVYATVMAGLVEVLPKPRAGDDTLGLRTQCSAGSNPCPTSSGRCVCVCVCVCCSNFLRRVLSFPNLLMCVCMSVEFVNVQFPATMNTASLWMSGFDCA